MSLALVLGSAQPSHPDAGSSQAQEGIGALRSPLTRDQWFVQHVLACEPRLMAYLRRHVRDLPNAEEVVDLRQEVYVRVYEAAAHVVPEHTAAFVLTTARHLLIDRFRRADLVPMSSLDDTDLGEFASPAPTPERRLEGRQELKLLIEAMQALPDACRQVVTMRRVECLSQRDVAQRLGIAEATVEKQVSKGMRLLTDAMLSRGVNLGNGLWARRAARRQADADQPDTGGSRFIPSEDGHRL